MIETYTGNATSLGVIGIISFIITSLLLINKVWSVINQIYHTSVNRNPLRRFAGFLTFLIVGTLLLAAYFSVQSVMSTWYTRLMGLPAISGWLKVVQTVSPWIITWVGSFSSLSRFRTSRCGSPVRCWARSSVCWRWGFSTISILG
jgi:membrane protein